MIMPWEKSSVGKDVRMAGNKVVSWIREAAQPVRLARCCFLLGSRGFHTRRFGKQQCQASRFFPRRAHSSWGWG